MNKMYIKSELTNAELLRELQNSGQLPVTNKRIQEFLRDVYGREVTISQIAAICLRYRDRPLINNESIDDLGRKFLFACRNDVGLAKRILDKYKEIGHVLPKQ